MKQSSIVKSMKSSFSSGLEEKFNEAKYLVGKYTNNLKPLYYRTEMAWHIKLARKQSTQGRVIFTTNASTVRKFL